MKTKSNQTTSHKSQSLIEQIEAYQSGNLTGEFTFSFPNEMEGITDGVSDGISAIGQMIAHPVDTIILPLGIFLNDLRVIEGCRQLGLNPNSSLARTITKEDIKQFQPAQSRMQERWKTIGGFIHDFVEGDSTTKLRILTSISITTLIPGAVIGGITKMGTNYLRYGIVKNPISFRNLIPENLQDRSNFVIPKTEFRALSGETMHKFVVTKDGRIHISKPIDPLNDWVKHPDLVKGADAIAAGTIQGKNGQITKMYDSSGHYQVSGPEHHTIAERAASRAGYNEAQGTFEAYTYLKLGEFSTNRRSRQSLFEINPIPYLPTQSNAQQKQQAQNNLVRNRVRDSAMNTFAPQFHFPSTSYFHPFQARSHSYYSPYFCNSQNAYNSNPYSFSTFNQFKNNTFSSSNYMSNMSVRNAVHSAIRQEMQSFTPNFYSAYLKAQSELGFSYTLSLSQFRDAASSTNLIISYNGFNPLSSMRDVANFCKDIGGVASESGLIEDLIDSEAHALATHYIICFPYEKFSLSEKFLKQIEHELAETYFKHKTNPFFSLHFNDKGFLYPVIHPAYENTLTGAVIGFLDYWMKGFLNGGLFDRNFLNTWHSIQNCDEEFLRQNLIDLKKYCAQNCKDVEYFSLRELLSRYGIEEETSQTYKQPYMTSFRIIAFAEEIQRAGNVLIPQPGFRIEYTIDPMPDYEKYIESYRLEHGYYPKDYRRIKQCYELYAEEIKEKLPKIPMCQEFFQLLGVINFLSYFYTTLDHMGKRPVFASPAEKTFESFPKALPPVPVRYHRNYPLPITFNEILQALSQTSFDELNLPLVEIFSKRHIYNLPDLFIQKIRSVIEAIVHAKLLPQLDPGQTQDLYDYEIERINKQASQFLFVILLGLKRDIHCSLDEKLKAISEEIASECTYLSLTEKIARTKVELENKLTNLKARWEENSSLVAIEIFQEIPRAEHAKMRASFMQIKEVLIETIIKENASILQSEIETFQSEQAFLLNTIIENYNEYGNKETVKKIAEIEESVNVKILDAQAYIVTLQTKVNEYNQQIITGQQVIQHKKQEIAQINAQLPQSIADAITVVQNSLHEHLQAEIAGANAQIAQLQQKIIELDRIKHREISRIPAHLISINQGNIATFSAQIEGEKKVINQFIHQIQSSIQMATQQCAVQIADESLKIRQDKTNIAKEFCHKKQNEIEFIAQAIAEVNDDIGILNEKITTVTMNIHKAKEELPGLKKAIENNIKENVEKLIQEQKNNNQQETFESIAKFTENNNQILKEVIQEIHDDNNKLLQQIYKDHAISDLEKSHQLTLKLLSKYQENISDFSEVAKLLGGTDKIAGHLVNEHYTHLLLAFTQKNLAELTGDNFHIIGGCGMSLPQLTTTKIAHSKAFLMALEKAQSVDTEQMNQFSFNGHQYNVVTMQVQDLASIYGEEQVAEKHFALTALENLVQCEENTISSDIASIPLDTSQSTIIHYASSILSESQFEKAFANIPDYALYKDQMGFLPIHTAAISGNFGIVEKLAQDSTQREAKTNRGATPLILAIDNGQLAVVEKLLALGADANLCLANGLFPLYLAIQNNYPALALALLNQVSGLDINRFLDNGMTALHLAIELHIDEVAEVLIIKNAILDCKRKADGFTPFHLAAKLGKLTLLEAMVARGISINLALESQKTVIHLSAEAGHLHLIQYLLGQSPNLSAKTTEGNTPLMLAIEGGHEHIALVLAQHSDINHTNSLQQTASVLALIHDMMKVADALLERGEKINVADQHGYDFIYYLAREGAYHKLEELLKLNLISTERNYHGESLLTIAAKYGHFLTAYLLMDNGFALNSANQTLKFMQYALIADEISYLRDWVEEDLNEADKKDFLYIAAQSGSIRCFRFLVSRYNPNPNEAEALLALCIENSHKDLIELTLKFVKNVNKTLDNSGNTALHLAMCHGSSEVVEILLQSGCDPNVRNIANQTAFHIAIEQNNTTLLKKLFKSITPEDRPMDLYKHSNANSSAITEILKKYLSQMEKNSSNKETSIDSNVSFDSQPGEPASFMTETTIKTLKMLLTISNFNEVADLINSDPDFSQAFNSTNGGYLLKLLFSNIYDYSALFQSLDKQINHNDLDASLIRLLSILQSKAVNPAHFTGENNVLAAIIRSESEDLACYRLELLTKYFPQALSPLAEDEFIPHLKVIDLALKLNKFNLFEKLDALSNQDNKNYSGFHQAVIADNFIFVQNLLKRYPVDLCNKKKQTPVMLAALNGNIRMVELLLQQGASLERRDNKGKHVLHYAILGKSVKVALTLIPLLSNPSQPDHNGCSPLFLAAQNGLFPVVRYFCEQKNYADVFDKFGRNALHYASMSGQLEIIEFLVQAGFSIDQSESPRSTGKMQKCKQRTPLHLAALYGQVEAVIKLVTLGANPEIADRFGNTLTEYAVLSRNTAILQLIQELPFYHEKEHNQKLLEAAVQVDHIDVLNELILDGISLATVNAFGQNLLHLAAMFNSGESADILTKGDPLVLDLADFNGNAPLHTAAFYGHVRIIEILINSNCFIDKTNLQQETALFIACQQGHLGAVCSLLQLGADISICNEHNISPLQIAKAGQQKQIVNFLEDKLAENAGIKSSFLLNRFGIYHKKLREKLIMDAEALSTESATPSPTYQELQ